MQTTYRVKSINATNIKTRLVLAKELTIENNCLVFQEDNDIIASFPADSFFAIAINNDKTVYKKTSKKD